MRQEGVKFLPPTTERGAGSGERRRSEPTGSDPERAGASRSDPERPAASRSERAGAPYLKPKAKVPPAGRRFAKQASGTPCLLAHPPFWWGTTRWKKKTVSVVSVQAVFGGCIGRFAYSGLQRGGKRLVSV